MIKLVHATAVALVCSTAMLTPRAANAAPSAAISSAFSIAKSNNKNQVHYAVDVDAACAPTNVHPYWRMLEKSGDATEPLEGREERAFGVERQNIDGQAVHVVLRGMNTRTFTIQTSRTSEGTCAATTSTTIGGVNARLAQIYVKLKLFGVDYVEISGFAPNGSLVRERVTPN